MAKLVQSEGKATMILNVRHTLPCAPDQFWDLFWDPEFERRLDASAEIQREMVELGPEIDGIQSWRIRMTPQRELPRAVAKLIGSKKLVYEQESRLDRSAGVLEWRVLPQVLADKVTAQGTMRIVPAAGGCERIVTGEISVRVPMLGGRIEKTIMSSVTDSYNRAAEVIAELVAERS